MTRSRRRWTVALVAALAAAVAPTAAQAAIPRMPELTVRLPGDVRGAANGSGSWIVSATAGADAIAKRHGARELRNDDTYVLPRSRARAFADDLRAAGLLRHAEPDVQARLRSAFDATPFNWGRGAVVAPDLVPPAPTARIGVLDTYADPTHPDLAGHIVTLPGPATTVTHPHGTMVSSAAAGAFNGFGVTGVYPGAQIVNYPVTEQPRCSDSANGIRALAEQQVGVIVASYGFTEPCAAEYEAIAVAYGVGTMVVAAAGNEFQEGNPVSYPAAWPHVLSVSSVGPDHQSSFFSSRSAAIDVAAPGEDVPLAIPAVLDTQDGAQDGVTTASGTSFSAPIVAGAIAWLRTARPEVSNGQAADLLRRNAVDNGPPGWDQDNGYGIINLQNALVAQVPKIDPLEPNDSIAEIDGTVFQGADTPVWSGRGRRTLSAQVDSVEDPIDVYRVRIPARSRWKVLVTPREGTGDPDLEVYDGAAKRLTQGRYSRGRSVRGEGRTDRVTLANRGRRTRTMYVIVYVPEEARFSDAGYRMQFSRQRFR